MEMQHFNEESDWARRIESNWKVLQSNNVANSEEENLLAKKYVRQSEANIYQMMRSVFIFLRLSGTHPLEFEASKKSERFIIAAHQCWNFIMIALLLLFSVQTFASMFRPQDELLPFVVDFLRLAASAYRSILLRYQRKKLDQLMSNIEKSLSAFPTAMIKEHRYWKLCTAVFLYSSVQGFALFRGVANHHKYLHDRYFGLLDDLLPANSTAAKLTCLADVWLKSFLFRATFILDVVLLMALHMEILKRYKEFHRILDMYTKIIIAGECPLSRALFRKFRFTHRKIRAVVVQFDDHYGPGMILWFSFFLLIVLADVNNVVANGVGKGDGTTSAVSFLVRISMVCIIFQLSMRHSSGIVAEAEKTLLVAYRLSCYIPERQVSFLREMQIIFKQVDVKDITMSCWKFFNIRKNIAVKGFSILIYYLVMSLQLTSIRNNNKN